MTHDEYEASERRFDAMLRNPVALVAQVDAEAVLAEILAACRDNLAKRGTDGAIGSAVGAVVRKHAERLA